MEGLEAKAKASGASQLVVKDLKEEFVSDYVFPCLRAGAVYERKYLEWKIVFVTTFGVRTNNVWCKYE